jgi:2-polyprenyl-6-methoxyphenol hydroxylase-like FAD-dependent oxidoreductase
MSERSKVLIVGAGPTGLTMAHELARDGIQCRVIDKAPHRAKESRAIAIHSRTLETFELMKIVDDFLAKGQQITAVRIYGDRGPIAHIALDAIESRYSFVLGVPQDETERILEEHIARRGLRVERDTELVGVIAHDSGVTARLRIGDRVEEAETDWLIGCDGAHSTVREQLRVAFAGSTYPERFVLADLKVSGEVDPAEARVWLHEKGALAFFPLLKDRYRLVAANSPGDWQHEPSLAQYQALVDERGPGGIRLSDLRWSSTFGIHRREAERFRCDRVFLLGDAAHIHSPIGGQGMNMGIQDAFNLAWKLSLVIRDAASPRLLESYEAERKPVDEAVIRQTDRATRLVSLHGTVTRFIRDHMMSWVAQLPGFEQRLGAAISGIAVNYRHSPIVEEHSTGVPGLAAGDRAPDAPLTNADDGAALHLYDLIAEHRHVLLLLGGVSEALPAALPRSREGQFASYRIAAQGMAGAELIDCEGKIAARFAASPAAYVIRPDGYVGFRCGASDLATHLPRYLGHFFGSAPAAVPA